MFTILLCRWVMSFSSGFQAIFELIDLALHLSGEFTLTSLTEFRNRVEDPIDIVLRVRFLVAERLPNTQPKTQSI